MSGNRAIRVAATSARVLTGAAVAAACVVGVAAGVAVPWPAIVHEPAQAEVTPLPGDTVLVCTGDLRAIGRDPSNPLQMVSAAPTRLTAGGSEGDPTSTPLSTGDLVGAGELQSLTAAADGRTAPLLGATESVDLDLADLSGFAAAPCRDAGTESWLVGGSVATGSEDLIILTNPGAVPSTVTLTVFGTVRSTSTSIVPAGTQVALPLSSIASGTEAPVVKVTATGSAVRAVLQSSLTRTLDPVGIDLQDAVAAPQRHPVIPGVEVFESDGDGAGGSVLRLLSAEADTNAIVSVKALGARATADDFTVPLVAGEPVEVSLSALEPGTYTVEVEAEAAVLAGVRVQDGGGPDSDFAWSLPAPELDEEVLVAVPRGPSARMILANDEETDAVVVLGLPGVDGGREITVPAGSSAAVDVAPRTVYSVKTDGPVHAAVVMSEPGALASWPVWPAAGPERSITVYP